MQTMIQDFKAARAQSRYTFRTPLTDNFPFTWYKIMRAEAPLYYDTSMQAWSLFLYEDVKQITSDYTTFSSRFPEADITPDNLEARQIIRTDPPLHRQLRSLVSQVFTPRRIETLEPMVIAQCKAILQPLLEKSEIYRVSRHPMAYASREGRCLLLDGRDSRGLLRTGFSAEERVYSLCVRKVSLAVRKKRCSMKDFQNKVAVVTGAASGIGRALSGKSAQEGMKVVLADIEESARKQAEEELTASGAQVVAVRTDVSQAAEVESLAQLAFATYGAVHLLCNNAGVVAGTTVWESSLADWQWVLGVNLWGVIYGLHSFVPRMLAQGGEGHIVNTASAFGLFSSAGSGLYKVSKQGVVTLSETLALELAARGAKLKVSVLCPEWVNTRISDAKRNRPQALQNAPEEQHLSPEMVAVVQAKRQLVQAGLAPSQVAEMVFDAIGQEKFYILTHPPHTKQLVQLRMQDILQERMPTDTAPDLFQFSQEAAQ